MIEVYSGLYVNEATDAKNPEQMDQISEKVGFMKLLIHIMYLVSMPHRLGCNSTGVLEGFTKYFQGIFSEVPAIFYST